MRLWIAAIKHPDHGELEVEFEYWPARKGSRDSEGHQLEPNEPAEIVIKRVIKDGEQINFNQIEDDLVEQIFNQLKE